MPIVETDKNEFIEFMLAAGVLRFGSFTLKSGRGSPYFFNLGAITGGRALDRLGGFYARALVGSGLEPDVLFGPAYKGIPLVTATAVVCSRELGLDFPIAYNRKEAKNHGEGGRLVGAPLGGRVVIVDDVVTAGTAVREALGLIRAAGAEPVGLLVAIDREERGRGTQSAVRELATDEGLAVHALIGLADILAWLEQNPGQEKDLAALKDYHERYGGSL